MTRINAGIPVKNLTDQHLFSEYREIGRVATLLIKRLEKGKGLDDIPQNFKLEGGHMLFFLDKGLYIVKRFKAICQELKRRNIDFSVDTHKSFWIYDKYPQYYNDWQPTCLAKEEMKMRLAKRVLNSNQKPKYMKKAVCPNYYVKHILQNETA